MKKTILMAAAFAAVAVLLCACGQSIASKQAEGGSSSGAGSDQSSSQSTQTQQAAQSDTASQNQTTDQAQTTAPAETAASADQSADGNDGGEVNGDSTYDAQNQADADDGEQSGEDDSFGDTGWNGTFYNDDTEETLNIIQESDTAISFIFTNSGIAASAQTDGNTATYYGDDNFVITFSLSGDTLKVSLSNTEDETDTSGGGSPLLGTYTRE